MKLYFSTFGCKVNSFESAAMAQLMREAGHTVVEHDDRADVVVVNSCTVTANGDKKVRQYLRGCKRANPAVVTVLCGCFPQAYPALARQYAEAYILMGTGNRAALPALLDEFLRTRARVEDIRPNANKAFELLRAERLDGHTRAFLKIEDGCERYCAYCVIPYARGPVRSMPLRELRRQAGRLAENGYREIVLTGINLSFFGREEGFNLADAVEAVAELPGVERIRLSSLEPDLLTHEGLARMAATGKLCPQFHLALQSGCDATLRRMNRKYTTAEFEAVADGIRALFDRPTFTTDVMVGFAGETEADFETSRAFVERFGFLKCHVFPYSRREGTAGARLPVQLEKREKERRAALMSGSAERARRRVLESFVGDEARVILEQPLAGGFDGYDDRYLPCLAVGEGLRPSLTVRGRIARVENGRCVVEARV